MRAEQRDGEEEEDAGKGEYWRGDGVSASSDQEQSFLSFLSATAVPRLLVNADSLPTRVFLHRTRPLVSIGKCSIITMDPNGQIVVMQSIINNNSAYTRTCSQWLWCIHMQSRQQWQQMLCSLQHHVRRRQRYQETIHFTLMHAASGTKAPSKQSQRLSEPCRARRGPGSRISDTQISSALSFPGHGCHDRAHVSCGGLVT